MGNSERKNLPTIDLILKDDNSNYYSMHIEGKSTQEIMNFKLNGLGKKAIKTFLYYKASFGVPELYTTYESGKVTEPPIISGDKMIILDGDCTPTAGTAILMPEEDSNAESIDFYLNSLNITSQSFPYNDGKSKRNRYFLPITNDGISHGAIEISARLHAFHSILNGNLSLLRYLPIPTIYDALNCLNIQVEKVEEKDVKDKNVIDDPEFCHLVKKHMSKMIR